MTDQPLTENERKLPPHLGGHFGNTNVDAPTLRYLVARYGIRSMVDVGCGPGGMRGVAQALGVSWVGIDGDPFMGNGAPGEIVLVHDYTTGPFRVAPRDLIWCTEFVEHVEAQYQDHYLATFDAGHVLFLTAAPPGFPGWHHVNCQPEIYWIDLLGQHGWVVDTEATQWVRANGGHVFSQRQGLVFPPGS